MNDFEVKKLRMMKRLNDTFKDKKIKYLSVEELKDFILKHFKTINRSSYYANVRILNEILAENGNQITVNSKAFVDECVQTKDEQYFTKTEIIEVTKALTNFQDKFIVYALWHGIMGKEYQDLLNIKVSDIAEDYSYININGKKFLTDDYMKFLLKGTIKQRTYLKFVKSMDDMLSPDTFNFNMSSPYLIKVKPTKRNSDGLNSMTSSALQRKLTKLQNIYFEECEEKLILSGLSLVKSGIMYDMFMQEVNSSKIWTIETVDEYLKMRGFKINRNELYRIYWNRYHDSKVVVY